MNRNTLIIFFLISFQVFSQDSKINADSIALSKLNKKYKSVEKLANELTKGLSNDSIKFRVMFKWIALNITYDYTLKNHSTKTILRKKNAICSGYSSLLKEMCDITNINCVKIEGMAKGDFSKLKGMGTEHSWNAVLINNTWRLCDVTWSAVYREKNKIIKEYYDIYYMMNPELFALRHYPNDKKWLLTDMKKRTYKKQPIFFYNYFEIQKGLNFKTSIKKSMKGDSFIVDIDKKIIDEEKMLIKVYDGYNKVVIPKKFYINENRVRLIFDVSFIKVKSSVLLTYNNNEVLGFFWK